MDGWQPKAHEFFYTVLHCLCCGGLLQLSMTGEFFHAIQRTAGLEPTNLQIIE